MAKNNFKDYKPMIQSPDYESENLGWRMLFIEPWFIELRSMYANESIAFWQFRRFEEMCEYIETIYLPCEIKKISSTARTMMIQYFSTFIEKHI